MYSQLSTNGHLWADISSYENSFRFFFFASQSNYVFTHFHKRTLSAFFLMHRHFWNRKNLSFLTLAIKSVLNLQIIKYKTFDRAMERWNTMEYNNKEEGVPKEVWCSTLYWSVDFVRSSQQWTSATIVLDDAEIAILWQCSQHAHWSFWSPYFCHGFYWLASRVTQANKSRNMSKSWEFHFTFTLHF